VRFEILAHVHGSGGEHEEEEAGRKEKDVRQGGVVSHQVEEKGLGEMIKIPLRFSLPFFWYQLVQINTSSLVRISNSKP